MTFKATVECDAFCCCNEIDINCHEPADAEDAIFDITEKGWLIDASNNHHYCPKHAEAAEAELLGDQIPTGIYQTMVN